MCCYLVIEEEVPKAWDVFGELRQFPDRLNGGALAAVKHVDADLLIGRRAVELVPHQAVLSLPQRVHIVDDIWLWRRRERAAE